jgi:hypothetical protein
MCSAMIRRHDWPTAYRECLSPELVKLAIDAGHVESTSVGDRGRLGLKDWELMECVIQEDFILVTGNAHDF